MTHTRLRYRLAASLAALGAAGCSDMNWNQFVPSFAEATAPALVTGGKSADTTVYRLDNGLTVVIREDHFAPVVAQQVWVRAGGADETPIEAGIAHVHEHMLFKGTARRGVGEIAASVEGSGGRVNAWTSWDHTVYHLVLASRFASEGLDILADAMRYSAFDPDELSKELGVVMEEYKRGEDSPDRQLFELLFDTAFDHHPYRRPVIGTEESINGLTREMILDFYGRYYAPNNMTLVVVGDVDTEQVRADVERLFGDFKRRDVNRPERPMDPPQQGPRAASQNMEVREAHLALGFHIPDGNHPDAVVLDVLSHIVGDGESSRLYRRLVVDEELTTRAGAFAYTPPDPGLFLVTAALEAGDEGGVLDVVLEELARVRNEEVTDEELARAVANLESEFIYRRQTVQGQARELGSFVVVHNDPNYDQTYTAALMAVTKADLLRAARQYLTGDNMTLVTVLPNGVESGLNEETVKAVAVWLDGGEAPGALASKAASKRPKSKPHTTLGGADTEPELITLANGVRIIVQEHHSVPLFSIRAAVLGGLLAETPENNGISSFVAEMLTRGTERRSRAELTARVESLAGSLGGFSGRNSLGLAAGFLSRHFDEGFGLFLEALLEPSFAEEDVEKTRRELLLAIKNREDQTGHRAFELAYKTVFPDHPYGMTTLGEKASIESITREDLAAYYRDLLDPSTLVVSVVGDIDRDTVVAKLEAALGSLSDDDRRFTMPPPATPPEGPRMAHVDTDKHQSHIVLAYPGVSVRDEDRHALSMLETVLSRQGGRLFYQLRDVEGLAYAVTAFSSEGLAPGMFGAYIATDPDNEERATDGLIRELGKVRSAEVEASEIDRARRYLLGTHEIGLQTNSSLAESMAFNELYGLGYDENDRFAEQIEAVTTADIQRVAVEYLNPDIRSVAVVGPAEDNR